MRDSPTEGGGARARRPARILVVDDDADVRALLVDHFEQEGYAVLQAADAAVALGCVRRDRPDLVLLDVALPGIDGVEALRRIRREDPGIGVIMITGAQGEGLAQSALGAGALDYFPKPLDLARLDLAVRSVVELFAVASDRRWAAFAVDRAGDVTVVSPRGSLDSVDAQRFKAVLADLIEEGWSRIVVDLAGVQYMDSSGLGALVAAMKRARATGGDLRLCGVQPEILAVLEMTGLSRRIALHGSRDEAITASA